MHKVELLEKRWFKYRLKKFVLPVLSLSIVSLGSYYTYNAKESILPLGLFSKSETRVLGVSIDSNSSKVKSITTNKILISKNMHNNVLKVESVQKLKPVVEVKAVETLLLSPIIPVIDLEKEEKIKETNPIRKTVKKKRVVQKNKTVKAKKNSYLTARELGVLNKNKANIKVQPRETKKMNFTSSSVNYFEMMKKKFSKSNNPRDALLLAKAHYKKKNYQDSEKWALAANKLNTSLEESWIVFAKSKVKLGKKKEALDILVSYHKKSRSTKVKSLIRAIQSGRI